MKVHFLRVVIIHQHWKGEEGEDQDSGKRGVGECRGKTLGCRANARNVREATHAPRKPIPVQTAHGLPFPHPSDTHLVSPQSPPWFPPLGYTLCYTLVLLLFHVCNAISMQCGYLAASFLSFPLLLLLLPLLLLLLSLLLLSLLLLRFSYFFSP